jgi:hypothetical protein
MNVAEYERMGRLIYGAHRLDGVLASMHSWMAEQLGGPWPQSDDRAPEIRCMERTALAKAYFAARVPDEPASSFVQLIENVRDLETATTAVRTDSAVQLSDALARLHAAHLGLAAAIDQLGYHARTAAGLRERAAELPLAAA